MLAGLALGPLTILLHYVADIGDTPEFVLAASRSSRSRG